MLAAFESRRDPHHVNARCGRQRRIDALKTAGKPDQVFPLLGVFVVRKGLVTEWTDYLDK